MNIVFMGTPDFAVAALEQLQKHHNIKAVFTQPDKPKNRGKKMQAPLPSEPSNAPSRGWSLSLLC